MPTVHKDEQDNFEGERYEYWRQHHHSHGHECTCHDHVNDEEGDIDDESDLEGDAHFSYHERGNENVRDILDTFLCQNES